MFKGEALGFGYKEIGVDKRTRAEGSPHEEDVGLEIASVLTNHVRRNDGDDGIPQPIRSSGESNATRADGNREDFASNNPCTRAPGGSEAENVDANERNLGIDGSDIVGDWISINFVGVVETDGVADGGNNELAHEHSEGTPDEERATTESLDCPERYRGRQDIDKCEDEGDEESITNGVRRLEERSRVVEDEVDTRPLLHHLDGCSQDSATKVALGFPYATREAAGPTGKVTVPGYDLALVLGVRHDFCEFNFDIFGVFRLTT